MYKLTPSFIASIDFDSVPKELRGSACVGSITKLCSVTNSRGDFYYSLDEINEHLDDDKETVKHLIECQILVGFDNPDCSTIYRFYIPHGFFLCN